jgi:hypothetical protein
MLFRALTSPIASVLFLNRLQLGDGVEVLAPPGGPLDLDQALKRQAAAPLAQQLDLDRVRQQALEGLTSGDLPEQTRVVKSA